jgi:chromosome segregation ATPase
VSATRQPDDLYYHAAVAVEQAKAADDLRLERDELQQRVSELSAAIELWREKSENLADAAASLAAELDHYKLKAAVLQSQIQRIHEIFEI